MRSRAFLPKSRGPERIVNPVKLASLEAYPMCFSPSRTLGSRKEALSTTSLTAVSQSESQAALSNQRLLLFRQNASKARRKPPLPYTITNGRSSVGLCKSTSASPRFCPLPAYGAGRLCGLPPPLSSSCEMRTIFPLQLECFFFVACSSVTGRALRTWRRSSSETTISRIISQRNCLSASCHHRGVRIVHFGV